MRLVYLVPNQAWVFLYGDSIVELTGWGRFFETRQAACCAAVARGLVVTKRGEVF